MTERAPVYIVDDDPGMLESTRFLLESVGLDARGFQDGRDFLEAIEPAAQGCVILDVRMPGLGGLNVQEELQQRGCRIPVIFVSGHADVPIVVRAFKSGAFDFIEKPFSEQLLLDSVQQALQPPEADSGPSVPESVQHNIDALTPRERDVFIPLAQGYTSREIAEKLEVGSKTADLYRARVMKRLGVQRPQDVTGIAIAAGLVDPLELRR
ncbi:response regulator [Halospina sp. K52047b]|uniref:response regulator transcription factor n=1 Tax=Halospina sp. K52047b TaxID=2614160 RepID=UPI00124A3D74|nr:response regulator [Halospina sp. K52047b]KAA8984444.1 response regulator transcription factor [Halospina sp. K52047b]